MHSGPIKTIVSLDGPDSQGAQPYGSAVSPGSAANTQLALAIAASNPLPARPNAPIPASFLATPTGNLPANTTYIAQVPGATTPPAGGYYPGDTVRIFFTTTQLAAHTVTVQTAPTPTTIGVLPAAPGSFAYIDIQLNPSGTAWVAIGGGSL